MADEDGEEREELDDEEEESESFATVGTTRTVLEGDKLRYFRCNSSSCNETSFCSTEEKKRLRASAREENETS